MSTKRMSPALSPCSARRDPRSGVSSIGILAAASVAAAGIGLVVWFASRGGATTTLDTTYRVRRGNMRISVIEGGAIKAIRSKDIKCEVDGQSRIISIVPEGVFITPADVEAGKVLVELDSSDMQERLTQQQITFEGAEANLTTAREALEIQKNQNESNVKKAELDVKFARMDLDKYLGRELAAKILAAAEKGDVDYQALAHSKDLGGAARQQKLKLEASIGLASEELMLAEKKRKWTEKLFSKEFVSLSDVETDKLAEKRRSNVLKEAKIALDLFLRYDFPKQIERHLSDLTEAQSALIRTMARARSELSQRMANLRSKQASYEHQKNRVENYKEQIEKSIIRATQPGLVIYASSIGSGRRRRSSSDIIEEGAMVRRRQGLISLPDITALAVEVKVHESYADKVRVGQRALITLDGFPDLRLKGRVSKVGILPDSQSWWRNPDLTVYSTDVAIEGDHSQLLKPGMNANVEIILANLKDVLSVPIQAITFREGQRVCYVTTSRGSEIRQVETGLFNDQFIEVCSGLEEGDEVLLHPPKTPPHGSVMVPARPEPEATEEETETSVESKEQPADKPAVSGVEEAEAAKPEGRGAERANADVAGAPDRAESQTPGNRPGGRQARRGPRKRLEDMTPEERAQAQKRREEMRKRFESMTPEQQAEMRKRMEERRRQRGNRRRPAGEGGAAQADGGS